MARSGAIDALLVAANTTASPSGGYISGVAAREELAGTLQAATAIELLAAGEAITASIVAPYVLNIREYDAEIAAEAPPQAPASVIPGILADAALQLAIVLAARDQLYEDRDAAVTAALEAQLEAIDALMSTRADVLEANAKAAQEAQQALDQKLASADEKMANAKADALADLSLTVEVPSEYWEFWSRPELLAALLESARTPPEHGALPGPWEAFRGSLLNGVKNVAKIKENQRGQDSLLQENHCWKRVLTLLILGFSDRGADSRRRVANQMVYRNTGRDVEVMGTWRHVNTKSLV